VTRFRIVPAAYVLLLHADRGGGEQVLLQLRHGTGYMDGHWALVAGHVEPGESVLAAACREAAEEAGIALTEAGLEPLTAMHRTLRGGGPVEQRADFFFAARRWKGDPILTESDKAVAMGWFALDALPRPVVPHEHAVLEAYARGDLPPIMTWGF
jgi:8-oxo-dGTP pyrophosphatase MutT (NUDIX family)